MNLWKFAALLGATMAALGLAVAAAQYPPAGGNLTLITPSTNVPPGGTQPVFVQLVDNQGQPIGNQPATASLEFPGPTGVFAASFLQVARPPTISPTNFTTDAAGRATLSLFAGDYKGLLRVKVTAGIPVAQGGKGAFTSQVQLQVGGTVVPAPPNTGSAGPASAEGTWFTGAGSAWAGAMLLLVASGVLTIALRARRRTAIRIGVER